MNVNQMLASPKLAPAASISDSTALHLSPSSTAIELAPIKEISSESKRARNLNRLPSFLEPCPTPTKEQWGNTFLPRIHPPLVSSPTLLPSSASSVTSESSNPPSPLSNTNIPQNLSAESVYPKSSNTHIPCRHAPSTALPSIQPRPETLVTDSNQAVSRCPFAHAMAGDNNATITNWPANHPNVLQKNDNVTTDSADQPQSPTMMAAAAIAAASLKNYPETIVNDNHSGSVYSANGTDPNWQGQLQHSGKCPIASFYRGTQQTATPRTVEPKRHSFTRVAFMTQGGKRPSSRCPFSANQKKFLTKNDHIKRPRNAWIHFRCHYGQALKAQDPTLRAEDISKRASRCWARLSESEKKPWHDLAEKDKQAHKAAFPEYRYCPRRTNAALLMPSSPSNSVLNDSEEED
ncbi:hypothetical protein BDF20DRAFT_847368 [Mycotypha africana]|uniref:uncharacterized protein n=1 Tax=Mycotypha africana TaxID=64632 RepID=UPI002300E0F4|nr:uncharacterized protein BDF20DRAFT_847368 [Mycotypha africana]KAI8991946.1 hypothetical protein BDF20DRAFT_847368 [Mycotypha africana]